MAADALADDVVLMPWTRARAVLADRRLRLTVLAPPHPALGLGTLRCLRVLPPETDGDAWHVTVGYDGYERR